MGLVGSSHANVMIFNRPGPKAGSIHGIEVCVCVCMSVPSPYIFSRPLIGPQIT